MRVELLWCILHFFVHVKNLWNLFWLIDKVLLVVQRHRHVLVLVWKGFFGLLNLIWFLHLTQSARGQLLLAVERNRQLVLATHVVVQIGQWLGYRSERRATATRPCLW